MKILGQTGAERHEKNVQFVKEKNIRTFQVAYKVNVDRCPYSVIKPTILKKSHTL